jgi:hypothetical protein
MVVHSGIPEGAPWDCLLVAITTPAEQWIRVVKGYSETRERRLGLPDFDLVMLGRSLPLPLVIMERLRAALVNPPLELNARVEKPDRLTGTSEYKPSGVLQRYRPPLRERATVRVDAAALAKEGLRAVRLTVATTLLVNTLATVQPQDWRLPTDPQEKEYTAAVLEALKKGLTLSCPAPMWRADKILTCDLTGTAALPEWVWP